MPLVSISKDTFIIQIFYCEVCAMNLTTWNSISLSKTEINPIELWIIYSLQGLPYTLQSLQLIPSNQACMCIRFQTAIDFKKDNVNSKFIIFIYEANLSLNKILSFLGDFAKRFILYSFNTCTCLIRLKRCGVYSILQNFVTVFREFYQH